MGRGLDGWHDPRVPADVDCVLRPLLERRAAAAAGIEVKRERIGATTAPRRERRAQ